MWILYVLKFFYATQMGKVVPEREGKRKQFLTIGKVKTFLEKGLCTCDVAFNLKSFRGKFPSSPLVID